MPETPPLPGSQPQVQGLISSFATCIEAYSFVEAGREFYKDYELEYADLSVDKLRLLIWGEAVGLAWRSPRTGIDFGKELLRGGVDPYAKYTSFEVPKILKDISIVLAQSRTVFDERTGHHTNFSRPNPQPQANLKSSLRGLNVFQESFDQFRTPNYKKNPLNNSTASKIASQSRHVDIGVLGLGRLIGFLEDTTKNYVFPKTLAHLLEKEIINLSNLEDLDLLSRLSGPKHARTSRTAQGRISLLRPIVVSLRTAHPDDFTLVKELAESSSSTVSAVAVELPIPTESSTSESVTTIKPSDAIESSTTTDNSIANMSTTTAESTRTSMSSISKDSYMIVRSSELIEAELPMLTWSDSICTTLRGQSIHESELEFEDPSSDAFRAGFLRRFAAARAAIPALARTRRQLGEPAPPLLPLPPPTRDFDHSGLLLHKIVMFGDGGVGKINLTIKLCQNPYDRSYDPTIEDSFYKNAQIDGVSCVMEVVDTAGQEEYTSLSDHYIREGDGFLLVYSIYDRMSFTRIAKYRYQIIKIKGRDCDELPIVLVAHDFSGGVKNLSRQISTEEGSNLAKSIGCKFVEASAETGNGVEDAFYGIVRTIRTQQSEWKMAYPMSLSRIAE